jgi:hypothetical protein
MRRLQTTLLWLPCCAALLTGCDRAQDLPRLFTETRIERPQVPPELLACADAPATPAAGATQRAAASYMAGLWSALEDCRGKLAILAKLLAADEAPAGGAASPGAAEP